MAAAIIEYFRNFILLVVSPKCYHTFFNKYDLLDVDCLTATASKGLGYAIIAGSILVKVPQIHKIWSNHSAEGISVPGQLLELYGVTAYVAYSYVKRFPFSSWGDGVFMLGQTSIINGLSLHYNVGDVPCFIFLTVYSIFVYIATSGMIPVDILWTLQASSVPVMFIGKMIQAFTNYRNKSMGQQSMVTAFLLLMGSLARVFTSVQETGDFIIIFTYSLASLANSIIVSQFIFYSMFGGTKKSSRGKKQPQPPPKKKKQR